MSSTKKETVKAAVLAGGSGSRLWPLSREQAPKQFLCIDGDKSMLDATISRISNICLANDIIVVTSEQLASGEAYHALKPYKVICEPASRNTAPAIAIAASFLRNHDPAEDPIILVLPADHVIQDIKAFRKVLDQAITAAALGYLVTLGITPSRPETGFGYIKSSPANSDSLPGNTMTVDCFVEKPDRETAQEYIEKGGYFWNSGIFVWRASAILDAIRQCLPEVGEVLSDIERVSPNGTNFQAAVNEHFARMPDISIDYGVLEKVAKSQEKLVVVPCDFQWSDVGSWDAIHEISEKDGSGNVLHIDCKNTLIHSNHRLVAAIGVEDVCLVETGDAILLAKRGETQRLKEIVRELTKRNAREHIVHLTVKRPWGSYTVLEEQPGFKMKRIMVNSGASLSLQSYKHRSEHWVVVSGTAEVTCEDRVITVTKNQSTCIPAGGKHRLENKGEIEVQLIEVQVGDYLGEDDIERYDDIYGRC